MEKWKPIIQAIPIFIGSVILGTQIAGLIEKITGHRIISGESVYVLYILIGLVFVSVNAIIKVFKRKE